MAAKTQQSPTMASDSKDPPYLTINVIEPRKETTSQILSVRERINCVTNQLKTHAIRRIPTQMSNSI